MKKIVVLTSGGDAPGMNAAIRSVVRTALHYDIEVFGSEMGYQGLVNHDIFQMTRRSVANCISRGGTVLKTARCLEFKEKATRDHVRAFLAEKGIDGLVVIGGDGSFRGAKLLADEGGPNCIGIPGTIDNDIVGTQYTLGFDTARNTALEAIDKIRDTAFSHERNFLIEVMGRNAGFLALDVGLAGGAEIIITPEFPLSAKDIAKRLSERRKNKLASIIVVAEGDNPGHSIALAKQIKACAEAEYRVCILGHVQRGGSPTAMDRNVGSLMGEKAVEALRQGIAGKMVALNQNQYELVDFPSADLKARTLESDALLKVNRILSEYNLSLS